MNYTARDEAIQREIIDPIEASGYSADAFDVETIASETIAQVQPYGKHAAPEYRCVVDPETFWTTVQANAR